MERHDQRPGGGGGGRATMAQEGVGAQAWLLEESGRASYEERLPEDEREEAEKRRRKDGAEEA